MSAEYNQKGAVTVKPNINIEVSDEFNLGVNAKMAGSEIKEMWPQMVYKPSDNKNSFYWARADLTRSELNSQLDS